MLRRLIANLTARTPDGVRQWIYRYPRLLVPLARVLKSAMPSNGAVVVTIPSGPNKGLKLAVDKSTPNFYWLNARYEGEVVEVFGGLVKPGMSVADVGAYIGYNTLMFARWVGAPGSVLSFEPDPRNAQKLRRNCELNDVANVRVFEKAVSDSAGQIHFAAEGTTTSHVIGDAAGAAVGTVTVDCVTLDGVVFSAPSPALHVAKIDVEDNEAAVLRGARRVLAELRPSLVIEIHSPRSLLECMTELRAAGYGVTVVPPHDTYQKVVDGALETWPASEPFQIAHLLCRHGAG